MLGRLATFAVVLSTLLTCPSARAALSVFWRNNPISSAAIADDPALANMQSWSLMATNEQGVFASAGLRASLPPGRTFYRHPLGNEVRPGASQQLANPAMAFHTYVTMPRQAPDPPGFNAPSILGSFPVTEPPLSFGGSADALPGTFSVSWGDPQSPLNQPTGTFELARLTFEMTILPVIDSRSHVSYTAPVQTVFIPTAVPEPHMPTVLTLVLAAPFVLRGSRP